MSDREQIAAALARDRARGVCHYCGVTDEQVDGDRLRWIDAARTVCSGPPCIVRLNADLDRAASVARKLRRKRSPGQIHDLICEEAKKKRRQYRAAAKARKGRVA